MCLRVNNGLCGIFGLISCGMIGGGGGLGVCCSRYKFVGESNIKRNKWLLILVKYFIKKCEK